MVVWKRAVVRVQLRVCTKTMAVVYFFTAAKSGVEAGVLDRVKGVDVRSQGWKSPREWSRWMWEK